MGRYDEVKFSDLLGKTLTAVSVNKEQDRILFTCGDEVSYLMYHSQDCCESVTIESIVGDLKDLIGSPIVRAEETASENEPHPANADAKVVGDYDDDSHTWTFYKLATKNGYVDIRWYGASNGYYSEGVDFEKFDPTNWRQ